MVKKERVRVIKEGKYDSGPVVYWMSRDQRLRDNWALLYAQQMALEKKQPLLVVFCLVPGYLNAGLRQYDFMLKGLAELDRSLAKKNILFIIRPGFPEEEIPKVLREYKSGCLVSDFNPLALNQNWKNSVAQKVSVPFFEVDAHNIVPCWLVSQKQEYGAYTLRPKLHSLVNDFLEEFPSLRSHPFTFKKKETGPSLKKMYAYLRADNSVKPVEDIIPGEKAGSKACAFFVSKKLGAYKEQRNDPSLEGQSGLSPYLHFGQVSAQRVALETVKSNHDIKTQEVFLEELIVRRELADNFCFYNRKYDSAKGFPQWAVKTLEEHKADKREYVYSLNSLEKGKTHDELWNAAQKEMVRKGKMHGYMRMYWAKKILEWTRSASVALRYAIYLNDKYELDGRDPNGYAGCAWSIGGVHDRAWPQRQVFGKIRYMSYQGCKAKFDINAYIRKVEKYK